MPDVWSKVNRKPQEQMQRKKGGIFYEYIKKTGTSMVAEIYSDIFIHPSRHAALSSVNDATTSLPFSALQTENLFCVI